MDFEKKLNYMREILKEYQSFYHQSTKVNFIKSNDIKKNR